MSFLIDFFILFLILIGIVLELNQRVFVYEDEMWDLKGRFETALEDDEDVTWKMDKGEPILQFLILSGHFFLFEVVIYF